MSTMKREILGENEKNYTKKRPIPAPSYPRQYRAIGLVKGQYIPSENKVTTGVLITEEGVKIEAVLLGRLMSLLKNHLDLNNSYLWVVYPRSKQEQNTLHLQLLGVWDPDIFHPEEAAQIKQETQNDATCQKGYFSVRGEVVFYAEETETVIIKIKQLAKKEGETNKFFKLKLKGTLPPRPLHHFYDLQVELEGENLVIKESNDIGLATFQKNKKPPRKNQSYFDKKPQTHNNSSRNSPVNKPIKKISNN